MPRASARPPVMFTACAHCFRSNLRCSRPWAPWRSRWQPRTSGRWMLLNSYWSGGWTGYMTRRRTSRANVLMNPYPAPSSTAISRPFERCSPRALRMQALAGEGPGLITRRGNAAMTPLHWAVRGNALSCAEWLLSKGADVDAETEAHRTPMHRAAEWNLGEMMWLLADCGARGARLDPADSNGRPDDNVRLAVPLAASLTSSANHWMRSSHACASSRACRYERSRCSCRSCGSMILLAAYMLLCAASSEEALPSIPIPTIRPLALVAMTGRPADIFHLQGEVLCLTVYLFADRM